MTVCGLWRLARGSAAPRSPRPGHHPDRAIAATLVIIVTALMISLAVSGCSDCKGDIGCGHTVAFRADPARLEGAAGPFEATICAGDRCATRRTVDPAEAPVTILWEDYSFDGEQLPVSMQLVDARGREVLRYSGTARFTPVQVDCDLRCYHAEVAAT